MCNVQSAADAPRNEHLTSAGSWHDAAKPSSSVSHVVGSFRPRPCTRGGGAGGREEEAVGGAMGDGGDGMGMRMRCGRP